MRAQIALLRDGMSDNRILSSCSKFLDRSLSIFDQKLEKADYLRP